MAYIYLVMKKSGLYQSRLINRQTLHSIHQPGITRATGQHYIYPYFYALIILLTIVY
ncbi:hypothetical protein [Nitrosomonas sp.]|uniref:hypothetical protein n=1 Tax=Nitrosomonas sp. TaxID=42353 RepID=UPI0025D0A6EE|nr:hypothetical protein [Nitrosomonas sp.]